MMGRWWTSAVCACITLCAVSSMSVLHVTDFHFDARYDVTNGDPAHMCHNMSDETTSPGQFGNYLCDAPSTLVVSAVRAMRAIDPNPDLILWTGDSAPHVPNTEYTTEDVKSAMSFVTDVIKKHFPSTIVLPVHGNHDYWRSNQQPDEKNAVYTHAYDIWKEWIGTGNDTEETMTNYGYYTRTVTTHNTTHHFLCLNTNLYYTQDKVNMKLKEDPGHQLAYVKAYLEGVKEGHVVHVIAHIAPGAFERNAKYIWFRADFNRRFVAILQANAPKLGMLLFGHGHTDTYRMFYDGKGTPVAYALLAPAVTPWFSSLPGAGANNPSVRHLTVDGASGQVEDYTQYYLNLSKADASEDALWEVEYKFGNVYAVDPPLTAKKMHQLLGRLKSNNTLFQQYYEYNSVSQDTSLCTGRCRLSQLCAIEHLGVADIAKCYPHKTGTSPSRHVADAVLVLVSLSVLLTASM